MRKVWLSKEDFELFHQDINPVEYEFFRTHVGTFKRMWQEQSRRFWSMFVNTFEYFLWRYGIMKDFPMTAGETHTHIDEIIAYIREQFVHGKMSTAKGLVMDCVIVTQNRNCIVLLDKASYTQNPFFMKETREIFRKLFGAPDSRRTYLKLLCGLQVYVKFAGAVVIMLRRWLDSEEIPSDDELTKKEYFSNIHQRISDKPPQRDHRMVLMEAAASAGLKEKVNSRDKCKDDKAVALVLRKPSITDNKDDLEPEVKKKKKKKKKSKSASLAKLDSDEPSSPLVTRSLSEGVDLGTRPLSEDVDLGTRPLSKGVDLGTRPLSEDVDLGTRPLSKGVDLGTRPLSEDVDLGTRPLSEGVDLGTRPLSEGVDLGTRPLSEGVNLGTRPLSEDVDLGTRPLRVAGDCKPKFVVGDLTSQGGLTANGENELKTVTEGEIEIEVSVGDGDKLSKELSQPSHPLDNPHIDKLSCKVTTEAKMDKEAPPLSTSDNVIHDIAPAVEERQPLMCDVRTISPDETKLPQSSQTLDSREESNNLPASSVGTSLEDIKDEKMIDSCDQNDSPIENSKTDQSESYEDLVTSTCGKLGDIISFDSEELASTLIAGIRKCEEEVRQFAASEPVVPFDGLHLDKKGVTDTVAKDEEATKECVAMADICTKYHVAMDKDVTKDSIVSDKEKDKSTLASDEVTTEAIISEDNKVDKGAVVMDNVVDNELISKDDDMVNVTIDGHNDAIDGRSDDKDPKKKLHVCHYCGQEETVAKNFKRCQKCRGRPNPSYYCSRDCQVKHWKTHRLDHKNSSSVTG